MNFWCDQIWSILPRGRINSLCIYGRTNLMKEILEFQGMPYGAHSSCLLPSSFSLVSGKGVRGEWVGTHVLYVCSLWSLWATTVIITMWHSWVTCYPLQPQSQGFLPLHNLNKVLCTHRPQVYCQWFLGWAIYFRILHWRKNGSLGSWFYLWRVDRVMDWVRHLSCMRRGCCKAGPGDTT